MIRRRHRGHWLLITQADHAALSGQLAEQVGGLRFAALHPRTILGCRLHDAGWPSHDDLPTLNSQGLPVDVFETPRHLVLPIWSASAEKAIENDLYAGLLVSLHSLCLSAMPEATPAPMQFESSQMRERFETNKFQHKRIEEQEQLRRRLEMRTDIPLTLGVAAQGVDAREDQLLFDFRWLQALDQLSLAICCSEVPFSHAMVYAKPGQSGLTLNFSRVGNDVKVNHWPFNVAELSCGVVGRVVAEERWDSQEEFREAYRAAPIERIQMTVRAER
jgi:Protein of unknown function (DUF3891)